MEVIIAGAGARSTEPAAGSSGVPVQLVAAPASPTRVAVTAAVNVKAVPTRLLAAVLTNDTAAIAYVQFIDSAGAGVLGTGVVFEVKLAIGQSVPLFFGDVGIAFAAGIAVGAATAAGGAVAAGAGVVVNLVTK
jgi:hypothetical protein